MTSISFNYPISIELPSTQAPMTQLTTTKYLSSKEITSASDALQSIDISAKNWFENAKTVGGLGAPLYSLFWDSVTHQFNH